MAPVIHAAALGKNEEIAVSEHAQHAQTSKHPVRYVLKDIGISSAIVNRRSPVTIMHDVIPSMTTAQGLFNNKDQILDPLNTSAELNKYTVEDVDSENIVHYTHSDTIQERYTELKREEKPKNQQLQQLGIRVERLERELRELRDDKRHMHQWELLSRGIQGLNLYMWTRVLNERQRQELKAIGIHTLAQLRIAAISDNILRACHAYNTIPQQYKNIVQEMATRRQTLYQQCSVIAHPPVTRSEFMAYIRVSFPQLEAGLGRRISQLKRLDGETGLMQSLFLDDSN